MTTYKKLLKHQGGLIKILDPLIAIERYVTNLNAPPKFTSDQIALLQMIIHNPIRYDLYQSYDAYSHVFPLGQTKIVRLLLNGTIYDVNVFLPRIQLL